MVDEVFIPLDIAQSTYYAHFVDCLLPKLVYVMELRRLAPTFYANLRVYMPAEKASERSYELLRHMNVTWTHQWPLDKRFKAIVWVCHTPPISPPQAAAILNAVRLRDDDTATVRDVDVHDDTTTDENKKVNNVVDTVPARRPRKSCSGAVVYASRPKRVTANGRNIRDEDGIVKALEARGRGPVRVITGMESMDVLRQVLGDACYLVGEHGTGLTNMIFLPPDATVLEMDGWNMYTVMWTMANAFGLRYAWFKHDKEEVDADQLVLLLNAIERKNIASRRMISKRFF